MHQKKRRPAVKIVIWSIVILLIIAAIALYFGYGEYRKVIQPNITTDKDVSVYVLPNSTMDTVLAQLDSADALRNKKDLEWWMHKKDLNKHLTPGHYVFSNGMSNRDVVNILLSAQQTPVRVVFHNTRTLSDLAGKFAAQLMFDSLDMLHFLDSTSLFTAYGLTKDNRMTLFIPNTYEMYWTATPQEVVERMQKEHDVFWNADRMNKCAEIGLTPEQVLILASIVYSENAKHVDEAPRIAGVYMNRLQKGMRLEADPTVVYAIGDFTKNRVYLSDLDHDSPYNTYLYAGLPPGPIHMPPISYIDAVLNYEHHEYIFLCARGDGSYNHYFAKTLAEHERNRKLYQKELNRQGIR